MAEKITNTPTPLELVDTVNDIIDDKLDKTGKAASAATADSATTATSAASADKLTTARTISLSGDVTGSAQFDGSANASISSTLANSGVTAGSYGQSSASTLTNGGSFYVPKISVDAKGRTTSASSVKITLPTLTTSSSSSSLAVTASTQGARTIQGSGISGTIDSTSTSGSGNLSRYDYYLYTNTGLAAGTYTIKNILQQLINRSHSHTTHRGYVSYNCNCNCGDSDSDSG